MKTIVSLRALLILLLLLGVGQTALAKSMELRSANTYYKQGDTKQALQWYEKAAEKNTGEAQVYARLVEIYADKKEWKKMRTAFEQIDSCNDKAKKLKKFREEAQDIVDGTWMGLWNGHVKLSNEADSLIALGDLSGASDKYEAARDRVRIALEIFPDRANFLQRIGNLYINEYHGLAGGPETKSILREATKPYERLVEVYPDTLDYSSTLVQIYFNLGDHEMARQAADQALVNHPNQPDMLAYAGRARKLISKENPDGDPAMMLEASDLIRRAAEQRADDPKILFELAELYMVMGEVEESLDTYNKVFEAAQGEGQLALQSCFRLGVAYLQDLPEEQQDASMAVDFFEKCVEIDADNVPAKTNLGIALIRTGTPENIERGSALLGN